MVGLDAAVGAGISAVVGGGLTAYILRLLFERHLRKTDEFEKSTNASIQLLYREIDKLREERRQEMNGLQEALRDEFVRLHDDLMREIKVLRDRAHDTAGAAGNALGRAEIAHKLGERVETQVIALTKEVNDLGKTIVGLNTLVRERLPERASSSSAPRRGHAGDDD